jgi:hypothetical protein
MPWNQFRNREIQRKTCLRGFAGRDSIKSCFFAAETLKENSQNFEAGKWTVPIGSFLTYFVAKSGEIESDPTKVKIFEKLGTNANAVQTLTLTGEEIGGTFTLTYGGQTTAAISAKEPTGTKIIEELVKLSTIATSENIKSTNAAKKLSEEAIKIEFIGELGNQAQPLLVVNNAGVTSKESKGKITATTTTPGTAAEKIMGVYDGPDQDFWGNTAGSETENFDEPIPVYFHSCSFNIAFLPEFRKYGLLAEEALKNCTFY